MKSEKLRAQRRATVRRWEKKNPDKVREYKRRTHRKLREDVFAMYGGACTCCGEGTYEFLSLEHRCGGGSAGRRAGKTTPKILTAIRRSGDPDPEFTVLCHNCNQARGYYGTCPHERLREEVTP